MCGLVSYLSQRTPTVFATRKDFACIQTIVAISKRNLSVSTSPPKYRQDRLVLTLNPDRMQELGQQTYDISGLKSAFFNTIRHTDDVELRKDWGKIHYRRNLPTDSVDDSMSQRFPPGTKGLLYYHHNGRTDISAGVRFRICDSPSHFEEGQDLQRYVAYKHSFKHPWSIPLYSIASYPNYAPVRKLLLAENLVDGSLLDDLSRVSSRKHLLKTVIYDMEQPFILDVSVFKPSVYFMTRTKAKMIFMPYILSDSVDGQRFQPYEGLVRCQLVRSRDMAHSYHLKFLEMLTPIRCVVPSYSYRIRQPRVGEYLTRVYGRGKPKLWTYTLKEHDVSQGSNE